ncbi:winged helix DNA-binding domain-containing protein [Streptomyces sp. NPDC048845]|uniref:winged helix DNA-binding domain-containing protein n=1 Tax=Streptomyces sp. NPDC048845 TaxID=3155390 RepID=UPI003429E153
MTKTQRTPPPDRPARKARPAARSGAAASSGLPILTARGLNRATLDRQLLLRRAELTEEQAVAHLVGVHAQVPVVPYHALWARLADFDPGRLSALLENRRAVRISLHRSTLHLVTAEDCLRLRPLVQPAQDRMLRGQFGKRLAEVDLARLAAVSRELVEDRPLMFHELGKELARVWPGVEPLALSVAARTVLALVQVPPRGLWGRSGQARHTTVGQWLGREPYEPAAGAVEELLRRCLAAFGPAAVADMQTWSGLTRLREVVETMDLRAYRDENGTVLYDLPDAPLPDPETPAPPRLLPEYDNVLLSFRDRTRMVEDAYRSRIWAGNQAHRAFLVDGTVRGVWRPDIPSGPSAWRARNARSRTASVDIEPFEPLTRSEEEGVTSEAARLLRLCAPGAVHDIRVHGAARRQRQARRRKRTVPVRIDLHHR